jgi:ABC-2 type transport system ATP-binding protein
MLKVEHIKKSFASHFTLSIPNFESVPGDLVALMGINGSGKSTFLDILAAQIDADAGNVFLEGKRVTCSQYQLKRSIGYLPQSTPLPPWSTPSEILHYMAHLRQLPKEAATSALQQWECTTYQDLPLRSGSFGMQKRVGLAVATMHDPYVLFLDEPFEGLDIHHMYRLENFLKHRKTAGKITILSTHMLLSVAELANRLAVMSKGELTEISSWSDESFAERVQTIRKLFMSVNNDSRVIF